MMFNDRADFINVCPVACLDGAHLLTHITIRQAAISCDRLGPGGVELFGRGSRPGLLALLAAFPRGTTLLLRDVHLVGGWCSWVRGSSMLNRLRQYPILCHRCLF